MDMETPGPSGFKWMEALGAQMRFLVILSMAKQRNASVNRGPPQQQLQPRWQPGTGVLVNTTDILLFHIALKPTYVSAEGRSAMDMETPGPSRSKWMEALGAQTRFLVILSMVKPKNASVNRHRIRHLWDHKADAA